MYFKLYQDTVVLYIKVNVLILHHLFPGTDAKNRLKTALSYISGKTEDSALQFLYFEPGLDLHY